MLIQPLSVLHERSHADKPLSILHERAHADTAVISTAGEREHMLI